MNTHNNYEPTSRVNYEQTTPNPYLNGSYLPPPPPEYYIHQRTGKAWKVAIPVVLLLFGGLSRLLCKWHLFGSFQVAVSKEKIRHSLYTPLSSSG